MKHIQAFESFISRLDELRLAPHWEFDRGADHPLLSRVMPYSNSQSGFVIAGFKNKNGRVVDKHDVFDKMEIDETNANKYTSKALRALVNDIRLKLWDPKSKKEFVMINLGKLCFYGKDKEKYYVLLKAKNQKSKVTSS